MGSVVLPFLWLARGGWPNDLWSAGHLTDDLHVDIEDHGGSLSEEQDQKLRVALGPEYRWEIGPDCFDNMPQYHFQSDNPFRRSNQFRNWLIFSLLRTMGLSLSRIPRLQIRDFDFRKFTLGLVPFEYSMRPPFEREGIPKRHVPLPTMLNFQLRDYLWRTDEHGRVPPLRYDSAGRIYSSGGYHESLFTTASGRPMTYAGIYSLLRLAGERVLGKEVSWRSLRDSWRKEMHNTLTMQDPIERV